MSDTSNEAVGAFDLIVRNGWWWTEPGLPRRRVDVGVRDGKVAGSAISTGHAARRRSMPRDDRVPRHRRRPTHYDPQITFDPYATMSVSTA